MYDALARPSNSHMSFIFTAYVLGDLVVTLGGLSPEQIFAQLQATIPHENTYFLEGLPKSWLVREDFLANMNLIQDGAVELVLQRAGVDLVVDSRTTISVPLVTPVTPVKDTNSSFVSYQVYDDFDNTAIFTLDECVNDDQYIKVLEDFWSIVEASDKIDTVVVDLRNNPGGDFTVAPAFLNHLNDTYDLFNIRQRQSEDFCLQMPIFCDASTLGLLQSLGVNTTPEVFDLPSSVLSNVFGVGTPQVKKFAGDVFVLTSGTTFSSANLFAGVVQNNGLGRVVGTPTGNTPTSWGSVLEFAVPQTDLVLYLTTSATILQASSNANAVVPDVMVATTRDDILAGRDAQVEWVLTRNTETSTEPTVAPTSCSSAYVTSLGAIVSFLAIMCI